MEVENNLIISQTAGAEGHNLKQGHLPTCHHSTSPILEKHEFNNQELVDDSSLLLPRGSKLESSTTMMQFPNMKYRVHDIGTEKVPMIALSRNHSRRVETTKTAENICIN